MMEAVSLKVILVVEAVPYLVREVEEELSCLVKVEEEL